MSAIALAARVVLACVLVVAATTKLRAPARTRAQMVALLGHGWLATAVPILEIAIAVALVVWWSAVPGVTAVIVLLAFSGVLVRAQTRRLPCPCFGGAAARAVGGAAILRNAWLVVLGVLATASPSGASVVGAVVAVVALGGVTGVAVSRA